MANYSTRIKELRTLHQWTQAQLAQKLNISKQAISQYEHGVRRPDHETLTAICDIFNVSTDYILGHDGVTMRLVDPLEGQMPLFNEEWSMIEAYRLADPGIREAVLKLLDVEPRRSRSFQSEVE